MNSQAMNDHRIAGPEDWAASLEDLRAREKEHTRRGDELARDHFK